LKAYLDNTDLPRFRWTYINDGLHSKATLKSGQISRRDCLKIPSFFIRVISVVGFKASNSVAPHSEKRNYQDLALG
jgi:hypothetical protein